MITKFKLANAVCLHFLKKVMHFISDCVCQVSFEKFPFPLGYLSNVRIYHECEGRI